MMPLRRAALPILVLVALAAPAGADHCEGYETHPTILDTVETPEGRYFVRS